MTDNTLQAQLVQKDQQIARLEEQKNMACSILQGQRNSALDELANAYLQLQIVSKQLAGAKVELEGTKAQLVDLLKKSEPKAPDSEEGVPPQS